MCFISWELKNPAVAEHLAVRLSDAVESVLSFPYGCPACASLRPLQHEYRKLTVENYLVFYWIDDAAQGVTVACVIYDKRKYIRML